MKIDLKKIFRGKDIGITDIVKGQCRYSLPKNIKNNNFKGYTFGDSIYIKRPKESIKDGLKITIGI